MTRSHCPQATDIKTALPNTSRAVYYIQTKFYSFKREYRPSVGPRLGVAVGRSMFTPKSRPWGCSRLKGEQLSNPW